MRVIPVIDLKAGRVVHAAGGVRDLYKAIDSPLAPGRCDPESIVAGFLRLHPFDVVYLADLDGIAGRGRNHDTVCALRLAFPGVTFWVDDGSATASAVAGLARMPNVRPVVGSETLRGVDDLSSILADGCRDAILSLDFKGSVLAGPPALVDRPGIWPETVIAMTLAAVGADRGPDLARLAALRRLAPGTALVAAGGVRGPGDLAALAAAGAAGVLVASALHAGKIKAGDLEEAAGHRSARSQVD